MGCAKYRLRVLAWDGVGRQAPGCCGAILETCQDKRVQQGNSDSARLRQHGEWTPCVSTPDCIVDTCSASAHGTRTSAQDSQRCIRDSPPHVYRAYEWCEWKQHNAPTSASASTIATAPAIVSVAHTNGNNTRSVCAAWTRLADIIRAAVWTRIDQEWR
ncbi:hypothetical protein AG1IA_06566 [Rhizoctonia solani AG-1 IA]|uniref:Uncharacterized protein n=1 Tax=Thanatephorus cucumeris (strain AG1-IA) TaxID=983506 RepID=L8WSP0_THACA|nr:hypothetical protein AG1IA_06566 [Rhizoctonia solani AG-1 IA]